MDDEEQGSLVQLHKAGVCSGADQKETPELRVTGLCGRNSPVTGEFPAQRPGDAENVSIWWRHHEIPRNVVRP